MNAQELLIGRRSIRKYKEEMVSKEDIIKIMEITKMAPSWCNYQIARYTFIQDENKIKELASKAVKGFNYNIKTLENAKNVLVLSYVKNKSGVIDGVNCDSSNWDMFDSGIASLQFCLAAFSMNVGTCIMGVIDSEVIKNIVNINENEEVAALIPFGYIEEYNKETKRLSVEQISRFI